MTSYKLLTPGPLTTSDMVKAQMLEDRCTWDDDYKEMTQQIRARLLNIARLSPDAYTSVLMQGSGSFVVESVLTSTIRDTDHLLVISNGAYGERIAQMAERIGLSYTHYTTAYNTPLVIEEIALLLQAEPHITHIAMVHCETTTGILNPIEAVAALAKAHNLIFIVDAMSSFGGVPIDVAGLGIDYLISSANKCIQGVPGFGFVIAKKQVFLQTEGIARSVSLDLYDQWKTMDLDGKWRFTSPTHVVAAFLQALYELEQEGGVAARYARYAENNRYIREKLAVLGFHSYIDETWQSPIITAFLHPNEAFDFTAFYHYMKSHGFVLYPGKLTDVDTFRIGNIGEIYAADVQSLCTTIENYMGVIAHDKN